MSTSKKQGGVNKVVLAAGLAIVLPMVALFYVSFGIDHGVPSVLEGTRAATFRLTDLEGNTWDLTELRGKPVVLNFWSTWCGPCRSEHAALQRAAELNPDVQFLGVIYSDEPEACRKYLAQVGTTYSHLVDDRGRTAIDYGVAGVPESFFIDASGVIVHKQVGPVNMVVLQALLQRLRGGS